MLECETLESYMMGHVWCHPPQKKCGFLVGNSNFRLHRQISCDVCVWSWKGGSVGSWRPLGVFLAEWTCCNLPRSTFQTHTQTHDTTGPWWRICVEFVCFFFDFCSHRSLLQLAMRYDNLLISSIQSHPNRWYVLRFRAHCRSNVFREAQLPLMREEKFWRLLLNIF